jgi:BlaI family transcriptional regulator, penicillinase repressor
MSTPRPTEAELDILRVLWGLGASTVRQIHDTLNAERDIGYTTILKLLQIMFEKGLVARDDSQKSHIYRTTQKAQTTQRQLVKDLLKRAFGGSTEQLVLQALSSKKTSKQEIGEIRRMLDELEGGAS